MKMFTILYYKCAADMEYPPGVEAHEAYYHPDGIYSHTANNRTIKLYNNEKMEYAKQSAPSLVEAWGLFMAEHPTCIIVGIEDERTNNQAVAMA